MSKLKIDFGNMFTSQIGEYGLTEGDMAPLKEDVARVHKGMNEKKSEMVWRSLPFVQDEIVKDMKETAKKINEKFDAFVVLGIGGSALGSKALFSGLKHLHYNELSRKKRGGARFYVIDNVDPDRMNALFDVIDVKNTCFHVITKSGATVETMSQFMIILNMLKDAIGKDYKDNIVMTTDKEKGTLKKIVDEHGFKSYIVPDGVGGRFSVLCPVGLLSAAVLNIDIEALLKGAGDMHQKCENENIEENPAYMYALTHCAAMKKGVNISVLMPYADALLDTAEWYAQLWAESLGKIVDNKGNTVHFGQTPVRALGVTDQHSQVQLYREGPFDKIICFIKVENYNSDVKIDKPDMVMYDANYIPGKSMGELINFELTGTRYAVTKSGKMNMIITLDKVDAYNIGALFMLFEMATAAAGEFLDINAFDQPAVETGKQATFALMGRDGYEDMAKELKKEVQSECVYTL